MDFFKSVLKGEKSLGFTYWVCYVLPNVIVMLFIYAIVASVFVLSDYPLFHQFLVYFVQALPLAIAYVLGFAVINSVRNRGRIGFWGALASLAVVIGMIRTPLELLGFTVDSPEYERELKKQFSLANAGLPKRIDDITTLNHISYDNKKLVFLFAIDESFTGSIDMQELKKLSINETCEIWNSSFESGEMENIEYRYTINNDPHSFFISTEDCI